MVNASIIFLAIVLLLLLLHVERSARGTLRLYSKTILSVLFIIAALVQPKPIPVYFTLILIGLIFSLGGDIFLALREKMFLYGIISFLIGHVFLGQFLLAFSIGLMEARAI